MKLYIKYMVNLHCKQAVKEELKKLGLHFVIANTGVVDIMENITEEQHEQIKMALYKSGLELIDSKKAMLIEKISNVIIETVRNMDEFSQINFSKHLIEKLHYNYSYLADLFSEGRGTTVENFIIYQKMERVKELIIYDELSFKKIASKMNYGSVAHLSNQYKKVTGLTLSHFKRLNGKRQYLAEEVRDL